MYHLDSRHTGGAAEYWEEAWNDGQFEEALRFCEVDPLRRLFERYTAAGMRMLEGGCGRGQYVAYYTARGVRVVGLDFANETLKRLHERHPHLTLCTGDVSALPFADGSFDVYYSGGVVEHFEAGAEPSLREAWRVLRPGGVLLISVPYFSPLRRALSLVPDDSRRRVKRSEVDSAGTANSRKFFQYAYTTREFGRLLTATGFEIKEVQGYSIVWGLYEAPLVGRAVAAALARRGGSGAVASNGDGGGALTPQTAPAPSSLLKRLAVSEDDDVPVAGRIVRTLRWACANMMMYVCIK